MPMPKVSIVVATYHRCQWMQRCVEMLRANVDVDHEVVVVGSSRGEGTEEWLAAQADLRFIRETQREGCCKAYNKGFRAARGRYVMWLNDDSYPLPGALRAALAMIERPGLSGVGM